MKVPAAVELWQGAGQEYSGLGPKKRTSGQDCCDTQPANRSPTDCLSEFCAYEFAVLAQCRHRAQSLIFTDNGCRR